MHVAYMILKDERKIRITTKGSLEKVELRVKTYKSSTKKRGFVFARQDGETISKAVAWKDIKKFVIEKA